MQYRGLYIICLLFLVCMNLSFRWPVENGKITSVFGESRWDHFHDGIDMTSPDNRIYPVGDGELAYFWDKSLFPLENYPGVGNYKIIRHRDNLYSIYLHLEDSPVFKDLYNTGELLSIAGNSGRSFGKHLHFSMLNGTNHSYINPFKLLPAFPDAAAPIISNIFIRIGDKYFQISDNSNIRLTRDYPILIDITDSGGGKERLGIHFLAVNFNNKDIMEINFDKIEHSKNELTISNLSFQNLFDEKGYYKVNNISYMDGANSLRITARDYRGNEATKLISFNVKLETERSK